LEVATPGPLGAAAVFLAVALGVCEVFGAELVAGGDAVADEAGAELVGGEVAGAVVSAAGEHAARKATPPPLSAARPATWRTVRRVVAVDWSRWSESGMSGSSGGKIRRRVE
jgi:hypothetical protein